MGSVSFLEFLKRSKMDFKKAKKYNDYYSRIMEADLFDKTFYSNRYPHVTKSGIDPLVHYLFYGYKERKLPNNRFNLEDYIAKYPEIKEKEINPLIYYLDNNHTDFLQTKKPFEIKKDKILASNKLFLNNFQFDEEPLVSIIILNRNGLDHLKTLFKDFSKNTNYSNYEIIVIDNASCDESVEFLYSLKGELPLRIIENDSNVSFSKANNQGAKLAKGEYLLLLNNDIEPTYGWLNEMVGTMLYNDNVGAVGSKLVFPYYSDEENSGKSFSIQHAGVKFREEMTPYIYGPYHENMFSTLLFLDNVNHTKEVIANTAACLLIPKDIYFELNGLDEDYFYGYEDIDFAFKLNDAGYKSIYCASALLFHHESATRQSSKNINELNFKNIMIFIDKWGNKLFKLLLKDKLEYNQFFTNKKLQFSIITSNLVDKKFIHDITKYLNKKGYNVNLISNINDLYLGEDCDVVLSFNSQYDINKVISRNNLIKVLFIKDEMNISDKEYDIFLDYNSMKPNILVDELLDSLKIISEGATDES